MARDGGRRGRDASDPDPSPVDQLETWRTWRHDDTAEFPAVQDDREWEGHDGSYDADRADRVVRRRRRPGTGVLVGAALLLAALAVSGLAAVGVGPVAHLLGSGDSHDRPSGTTGTSSPATSSPARSGSSTSGSSAGTSSGGAAAPSGAPVPGGAARSGAAPGPRGTAAPGPGNAPGPPGGHQRGTPPGPPAGGPGA